MFLNERIVFEIPIYSMSEKEFNRRWDKRKKFLTEYFMECGGNSEEQAKEIIFTCHYPAGTAKHNVFVFRYLQYCKMSYGFYRHKG